MSSVESSVSVPLDKTPIVFSGTEEQVEMDHMRKLIAGHMRKSIDTAAHVYVVTEVDMSAIAQYVSDREDTFYKREGFSLTITPFIIQACVIAINSFPEMNASLDGTKILFHKNINIGLAVAVEKGLMVPVISKCEELNFLGICRKVKDLALRTRNKQLNPDELQGSTFSISNFGVFNVTIGTPIINQPNVGILGVGAIKKRPVVIETDAGDTIGIKSMMNLSLGFDHRLIDGSGGSKFIDFVRKNLENMNLESLI
jgi:2-oxoglutarate dehydrogenase E2 component (dihydrolipoamide succinyltransferase)